MYTRGGLLDLHERTHRGIEKLVEHCSQLDPEEFDRELDGFAYSTVRLQLHHMLGAEKYWVGVLRGRIDVDDDADYTTLDALSTYRQEVFTATEEYLEQVPEAEINTPRRMETWGGREVESTPALVLLRTQTHLHQHQGQVVAMCRLMGKRAVGLDFPIT